MRKKYIVEIGMGADLHGQDMTKASRRAVKDAISRSCLCGLQAILGLEDLDDVYVDVTVAVPAPAEVDCEAVLAELPVGRRNIQVVQGGMSAPAIFVERFADKNEDVVVAVAAVTVSVDI